jgi:DNA-binding transcriptional regulator YiaG
MRTDDLLLIAAAHRMLADGTAKRLRVSSGLSQGQVGAACGPVTAAAVSRWELGERLPRTRPALLYARLLDRLAKAEREVAA